MTRREWSEEHYTNKSRTLRRLAHNQIRALLFNRVRAFQANALPSHRTGSSERIARAEQPARLASILAALPVPALP